jgi:imidazoleglycerol-phosphate dehydratase/histidinol-phosphatase
MLEILEGEGIVFSEVFIDKSFPHQNLPSRKPGTALLTKYLAGGVDLEASFVIGDRLTDITLAENLGCRSILIGSKANSGAVLTTTDWMEISSFLHEIPRTAKAERKTGETFVSVSINLDGQGKSEISTGIGFFDHLLEQVPRHGFVDLKVKSEGDLHTDEHHTIEDVAIVLGKAFSEALGKKKGIERYGFTVPMDDCLASVAIDFGGRPWVVWDAEFRREKIGEMPSEMFFHFFKSFSDNALCNLNIKAEGENEHHKIEAIFKAFARALKMAVNKTGKSNIPSSKGVL